MKPVVSLLALSLLLLGTACRRSAALPSPGPAAVASPAPRIRAEAPAHPRVEMYINQFTMGDTQGSTMRPDMSVWNPQTKAKYGSEAGPAGEPPFRASYAYLGREGPADVYQTELTIPAGEGTQTISRELRYEGIEIELWRGDEYRIGIRPRGEE